MINSSEEAIRKVLAGLRGCDVPLEMEQRILKAVQDQASAESRSGWHWSRPLWLVNLGAPTVSGRFVFAVVVTGVLAVALTIPLLHRAHRVGDTASQIKRVAPRQVGSLPLATPSLVANGATVHPNALNFRSSGKKRLRAVGVARPSDSLALNELHAASRPFPPLPLTRGREDAFAPYTYRWSARVSDAQFRSSRKTRGGSRRRIPAILRTSNSKE